MIRANTSFASRRHRWRVPAAVAVGLLAIGGLTPAHSEDINQQVAEADDDLASADEKVAAAIEKLTTAKSKLPAARQELADAQAELTKAQQSKARADLRVAEAIAAVAKAKEQISKLEQQIAYLQNQIGQMARSVYTQGGDMSEIEVLLDSDTPGDFALRIESLRSIARGNNNSMLDLAAAREELDQKLAQLAELEAKAEKAQAQAQKEVEAATRAKARADAAKAEVDRFVGARSAALREANARKSIVKRQYNKLKAEQERIAAVARAAAAKRGGGLPGVIGPDGMEWPAPGASVSGSVGPRIHPVYGYRSCHTGADISAGAGSPIHSTAAGIVLSTDSGGPYGNHVVVLHGGGLSSMYAHMASFAVSPGDKVSQGEVLGYVGSTGWSTGPHLHFEIHVNGVPYDPMGWFGGAKVPVAC